MSVGCASNVTDVSRFCAQGLHNFCPEDRTTCACSNCHLGPCQRCGADNLQRIYADGTLCYACERADGYQRSKQAATRCDSCNAPSAFRNPGPRRNEYLCSTCHGERGGVELSSSTAHLALPCKGQDVDDPLHLWVHIRGSRFHCLCGVKKYDSKLRDSMFRTRTEIISDDESSW